MADSPQKSALGSVTQLPVKHTEAHAHDFHAALEGAMGTSANVKNFVHLYDKKEYEGMKTFLSPDKASGYAVKPDGDVVSVFSTVKGRGDNLVQHAIQNGGNKLDAYDGYLPTMYAKHGFQEYKREKNWTPGGPDVVYMHKPESKKLAASEANDHLFSHAMNKSDFYKKTHADRNSGQQSSMIFLAVDGDSAGQLVGRAVLANDEQALHDVSERINHGQDVIRMWAENNGGTLISAGGDEGNVKVPPQAMDTIEEMRADYAYAIGLTLTVGAGSTLSEAGKALMVGKLRGKNQVCHYDENVEQEYLQAQQAANDGTATGEGKKLGDAYLKTTSETPMQESEDTQVDDHSDCPYCAELADTNSEDPDHCQYCHDLDATAEDDHSDCPYCQEMDAEHDPMADGHPDDCPYCAEMGDHADPAMDGELAAPSEEQSQEGFEDPSQLIQDVVDSTDQNSQSNEEVVSSFDTDSQEAGMNMEDNVSRPEDYDSGTPGDMGLSEDEVPQESPDLSEVLRGGLDSHSSNIQREKIIQMVGQALEGFKACRPIIEKAQQQAPQLYDASLMMLKSMIEMAKMLGLAPNDQKNPMERNSQSNPQDPQSSPQASQSNPQDPQSSPQGETPEGKLAGR